MKSFPDLFEEVYYFSGFELVSSEECVATTYVPATCGTTARTMVIPTASTKLTTFITKTNEKLKYSVETTDDISNDYESDGYAKQIAFNDTSIENAKPSGTTSGTKVIAKPTEGRKCNGPPCLIPYVTTIRGETRDFLRILKDLNNNHLDSHSSDYLFRK